MSSSQQDNWQRCGYSWSRQLKPQLPIVALTKVAEEVNKMNTIYDQLFKQYSEELEAKVKSMNSLLEPVLIIFVGSIVALILISMYMPIFQIGTSIS